MLKKWIKRRIRRRENLAKMVADLREALEQRDNLIREQQDEIVQLRRSRAKIADDYLHYKCRSVYVPKIERRW